MITGWLLKEYIEHLKTGIRDLLPSALLERNRRFKGLHEGERCFILGSGHSIMEADLTLLADEVVMTQNHFHAHPQIATIRPAYHVIVPKYQPQEFDADWREWLDSMSRALPEDTVLFCGQNTKYLVDQMGIFRERAYYQQFGYRSALLRRAPVDLTRWLMVVPTVLPQCLAIAIYMGFGEIFLLGFDMDQVCRTKDRNQVRFYGLSPITRNRAEIDEEERAAASGIDWLQNWVIWEQCNLLRREAEARGIRIINAAPGGLLNMFERRPYPELLGRALSPAAAGES